jgi:hypothetical protein
VLPPSLFSGEVVHLAETDDGGLWINTLSLSWRTDARPGSVKRDGEHSVFRTVRYERDSAPPSASIRHATKQVSNLGNTTIAWTGSDSWRATANQDLRYSWRLDGGKWSSFSADASHNFQALGTGCHTFEVKARDLDFNESPDPAVVAFVVAPPVWRELWFIGLVSVLMTLIVFQTSRVVRRDRRLQVANAHLGKMNDALSDANNSLFKVNQELQQKAEGLEEANEHIVQGNR